MSEDEEQERRQQQQQEINLFAAMAVGDYGSVNFDSTSGNAKAEEPTSDYSLQSNFTKAASQVEDSGTFSLSKTTSRERSNNLEAAAAALTGDLPSAPVKQTVEMPSIPLQRTSSNPPQTKMKTRTAMTSQKVELNKPLFFGPHIAPHIVEEARQIVKQELSQKEQFHQCSHQVKNLVGAFRTYGNGISLLPGEESTVPNSQVSAYCPKWSTPQPIETSTNISQETNNLTVKTSNIQNSDSSSLEIPTIATASTEESAQNSMSERDWFSMMALGREDGVVGGGSFGGNSSSTVNSQQSLTTGTGNATSTTEDSTATSSSPIMSNRDLFAYWARKEGGSSTAISPIASSEQAHQSTSEGLLNSGTFLNIGSNADSDDDSVVGSELKKKVGVNEHLNAALASLEQGDDWQKGGGGDPALLLTMEETPEITQIPLTQDGSRTLSNHELMDGSTPLFSVDDSPLPVETDLGIHETRDEQQRCREQRKIQAIIESVCPSNVFGSLACPNPSKDPNDNHSWNSRSNFSVSFSSTPEISSPPRRSITNKSPSTDKTSNRNKDNRASSSSVTSATNDIFPNHTKVFDPRQRFGWWNASNSKTSGEKNSEETSKDSDKENLPIQLASFDHAALTPLVETSLEPRPQKLHDQNRPLSHLHPATPLARALPFLSDRPPSFRYLQIDTQAVGFPSLGGEIEPLFCSLAIYHVEAVSPSSSSNSDPSMAPIPDLQRCGKVTETLHFDIATDPELESTCEKALWPFGSKEEGSSGTRCGVFPLPSNLSIHNLYAAIIVQKVISEGSDFEAYLRQDVKIKDLTTLRQRAEKSCVHQGKFLMPFCFGVAPLLQVFGADTPLTPSSRAVQIPLFRFSSGLGERQIIDHIMVMLYPRADHSLSGIGGPAPVTNGGTAMLVMRNFGYLGLNSVIHSKSSLARDRLVDITGELQLRRYRESDVEGDPDYLSEPTIHGGRNGSSTSKSDATRSTLYAQELAPLSLHPTASKLPPAQGLLKNSSHGRGGVAKTPTSSGYDIEPYFYTTFCNQFLCHPKGLKNCPKGNIVVKVELREIEWSEEYHAYYAHLPSYGPAIVNPRRGPFLVNGSFTSCSSRCIDPKFLDEFKIKLPLVLSSEKNSGRVLSLFFSVYKLSFSTRKKWARRLRGSKRSGQKVDEIAGDLAGESTSAELDATSPTSSCQLIQLSCGHLPIAPNSSLLPNGNHEVLMTNCARHPRKDVVEKNILPQSTLIVSELTTGTEEAMADSESVNSTGYFNNAMADTASATSNSDSIDRSDTTAEDNPSSSRYNRLPSLNTNKQAAKQKAEPILLQVRIAVQSSLHAQNPTLSEFFSQETGIVKSPRGLLKGKEIIPLKNMSREEIYESFGDETAIMSQPPASHNNTPYDMDKLLISTVDISKPSLCSVSDISSNLLRILLQLWKIGIAGTVESDLSWANPNSIIPLRIHAFATMLQLLGSSTLFLSKRGATQLDGTKKWTLISLSRVLALVFDEGTIFGDQAGESLDGVFFADSKTHSKVTAASNEKDELSPKSATSDKKRRHVRSNFEFLNNSETMGGTKTTRNRSASVDNSDFFGPSGIVFSGPSDALDHLQTSPDRKGESSPRKSLQRSSLARSKSADAVHNTLFDPTPPKIDSVFDFKNALEASYRESENSCDEPLIGGSGESNSVTATNSGEAAAQAMIKAFSGPVTGRRRWMTAPAPNLATIAEDSDATADVSAYKAEAERLGPLDSMDTELFVKKSKSKTKQMRVPNTKKTPASSNKESTTGGDSSSPNKDDSISTKLEDIALSITKVEPDLKVPLSKEKKDESHGTKQQQGRDDTLPTTDEIESAGISFLEAIERSFGLSGKNSSNPSEEKRVGQAHHRKTRSNCSIDWTIPNDDLNNSLSNSPASDLQKQNAAFNELDMSMSTLSGEMDSSIKLPNFFDRLVSLQASNHESRRWFPFAYEILIMQWLALLRKQQAQSTDTRSDHLHQASTRSSYDDNNSLSEAASRTGGVVIACAPVLFEIIKQSLGWRVANLFQRLEGENIVKSCPSLGILDDTLLDSLEQLIFYVTEACLDSRNFDSWETRSTCIDVNDSIVLFLRDLFAFLDPTSVHRLIKAYMAKLVKLDGQRIQDRDSSIGLRWSWEVTKLQMNAISALVRFPDFIKVNSPQSNNWGDWWTTSVFSSASFFDSVLTRYDNLGFLSIVNNSDNPEEDSKVHSRMMEPHWLSEIVLEVCVLGIEHAEQNIQRRAASLLLEMFWQQSQDSLKDGSSSIVASMYVTFLEKIIARSGYFSSCFHAKSQVRQDVIRCVVFVLQSSPSGLLRALWRRLCARATGKGSQERFGSVGFAVFAESSDDLYQDNQRKLSRNAADLRQEQDIFEMFGLLNLCLSTMEYEGSDEQADLEGAGYTGGPRATWRKEYIVAREIETMDMARRRRLMTAYSKTSPVGQSEDDAKDYATSSSRKWHAHDGASIVIKATQQIVRELRSVLEPQSQSFFNPARRRIQRRSMDPPPGKDLPNSGLNFSYLDTVIFVRAALSVFLHSLTLRQSDIVFVKTLNAAVEIVKIFGIKIFNEAVGETLQHWMRVVSFHCGSRRAEVRVPASDFLELILRSTWDTFGSFFRIRVPLLAVQTEVMERIVATAASRHYRDQRKMGSGDVQFFSNGSAEASLAPLWRTLDRLHHQSASQNVAFKSALIRLAEKLKKLFRAYIAAHALSFLNRSTGSPDDGIENIREEVPRNLEAESLIRASRTRIHRVINASAGYSKQFLGFYSTSLEQRNVAHHEAVEDAFLDAADVFSPTELPDHRVAWLRKLAEFHESRCRFAEEAVCHYQIYVTYKQASRLHGDLWSSTPFLPWTDNRSDGIHLDGEGPVSPAADDNPDYMLPELDNFGRHIDQTNSFRRIFYRHENSIRNSGDLDAGTGKFAFFGVTLASEYHTVSPWITLREMEANMLEEAEAAGDLFLLAGIVASSRYVWSLATRYYAEKFSYGRLAHVYERLSQTVVSRVPPIDSSLYQEVCVTEPVGRFYRVWFHGGAPDELMGAEFVYRTASTVTLDQFGKELKGVVRCIVPEKTPIHLVLDGRPEESSQQNYAGFSRMGATLEPVKVKVTPLRPLMQKSSGIRGLPEWFDEYIDRNFHGNASSTGNALNISRRSISSYSEARSSDNGPHHREQHGRSFSASIFSTASAFSSTIGSRRPVFNDSNRHTSRYENSEGEGALVGADNFSFIQPINKGRGPRGARDWLKGSSGDFSEKALRVTELQVGQAFPACVSRQVVVHRVVYTQSPLEAAVDGICQWCAVLFRTAIATNGQTVLGINNDPGIGVDAAKAVSDSIHSSRVKEIGIYLLKKNTSFEEKEDGDVLQVFDRLGDDEVNRLQLKLARSLVVFMELIHLLIARNRNLLLSVIHERKNKTELGVNHSRTSSMSKGESSMTDVKTTRSYHSRQNTNPDIASLDGFSRDENPHHEEPTGRSHSQILSMGSMNIRMGEWDLSSGPSQSTEHDIARTDKAIGIQSELQRGFIALSKDLYPMILEVMGSDTPRWLKSSCQDSYFSSSIYRNTRIPIGEELAFEDNASPLPTYSGSVSLKSHTSHTSHEGVSSIANPPQRGLRYPSSPGGSLGSSSAVSARSLSQRSHKSQKSFIG